MNGVAIWSYFFDKNTRVFGEPHKCERCGKRIRFAVSYGNESPKSPDSLPQFFMCKRCHVEWHKLLQREHGKFYNSWDGELFRKWFEYKSREVVLFT